MMVSFVLSFFPRDVLDEILNLIESVSEDFPSYSYEHTSEKEKSVINNHIFHNATRFVSIVATCIAVHFAVCHALYNNKNKKIGKNRCLVFLNDLVLFCSVILSL